MKMCNIRSQSRRFFLSLAMVILFTSVCGTGREVHPQTFPNETVSTQGVAYYVAPGGDDSNPGTEAQPWRTIQKAAGTLAAGDIVYIRAGAYAEQIIPQNSGSAGNYITYAAYPGEIVTIDGSSITLPAYETGLFMVEDKSYIRVSGLRIINAGPNDNNAGIYVDNTQHIIIENNYTANTISSGIGVWNSYNIMIDGNEVTLACNDGEQEAITVAGTDTFEIKNNHVHHGGPGTNGGEGIDAKDGSRNGKIYNNHVHHINGSRTCLYIDAWDKHTFNIEVYQNRLHACGAGISLASEMGGLLENIKVYNNIAYQTRSNGLEIGNWGEPGISIRPVEHIIFANNTVYNNGADGWGNGFFNENPDVKDIVVRNNIFSQNLFAQIVNESPASLTIDHNLIDGSQDYSYALNGTEYVTGDPRFADVAGADFRLQSSSPAIDSGSAVDMPANDFDGVSRPQDGDENGIAAYDLGAYEVSAAPAINYYVAPDGDDNQSGTLAQPWRTIQKAANTLQAGETVYVREGVYPETVTVTVSGSAEGGYITFQNYPGERPILDGAGITVPAADNGMFLIVDQHYLIIKGFEIRNYRTSDAGRVPVGINVRGAAHHIQLKDNRIHHIETQATPAGPDLLGADAHGIAVYGTAAPDSINNIIIEGNDLYALKLGSSEAVALNGNVEVFTVTNNLIHDSDNIGLDFIGFEGTAPDVAYDQARNGLVSDNTIYNIDTLANPSYGGDRSAGGIYVDGGTDILIERNKVYTANIGLEIASEHQGRATSFVTVRNNFLFNNHMAGLAMGGYDTNRGRTENCIVVNNTLYNNDTQQDGNGELLLQFDTRNNVIKNNIIFANSQNLLLSNPYAQTNNVLDYNLFYAPGGLENSEWQWAGTTYTGFANYQAGTGNDGNALFTDPLFVDPATFNLHLQATSPAIDAGQPLAEAGDYDIDGQARSQGDAIDLGADEVPLYAAYLYLPLALK